MQFVRYQVKNNWALILGWIITICFSTQAVAAANHVLQDVKVVTRRGNWHVVLTGSEPMTYRTVKTTNPLRVVVDLANTLSETTTSQLAVENQIIGTIKTATIIDEPQPLTRVEINLNKDVPYETTQIGEQIWVSFGKGQGATSRPSKEQKARSSTEVKKEILPPATKLLAVQWVASEEKIDFDIICDGRVVKYIDFVLPDPPRLVVDVFGIQSADTRGNLEPTGPWVKRIRLGLHPNRARIVFDLGVMPEAGVQYQIILRDDRLEVSFKGGRAPQ